MIVENVDLTRFNTFGIKANAKRFARFTSIAELDNLIPLIKNEMLLVLGGGSNILLTGDFDGLVLKNEIKGIEVIEENDEFVVLKSGAGEVWHEFVLKCIASGYGGVENLSLIPGSVGAGPMQNIGAYGVEIKDVFESLEAYHIENRRIEIFSKEDCQFGYRESVFKRGLKGQYIICSVTFRLSKIPVINTRYGAIEEELQKMGVTNPTIRDVSNAVINIRTSKLPDPAVIGNAGSFFKNPVVSKEILNKIQTHYSDVPFYPAGEDSVKLAAGWLIEKAGWKGKRINDHGVHEKQALVLVNYGKSEGNAILNLSQTIIDDIQEKFGVNLEREVNII